MAIKTTALIGDPVFSRLLNDRKPIEDKDLSTLQEASQCELAAKRINAFFQEKVAPNFSAITLANSDWQIIFQNMQKLQTAMDGIQGAHKGRLLPAMKTLVLGRLQAQLKALKNEPASIKAFLADVNVSLKLFPERLAPLKRTLELLLDPHAFTTAPEESLAYKEINVKSFADMAKGELFKALLASDLQKEGSSLEAAIETASKTALQRRIQSALPQASMSVVKKEMEKIDELKRLNLFVNFVVTGIHSTYDEKSNGQFSKLIATYSDRDMRARKPDILKLALKQHKQEESYEETILRVIEENYKPFYDWLLKNRAHVKQAYNQGDDDSRNQGKGTCFQNALDRLLLLKTNPLLPAAEIPMGSSNRGRFAQALVNQGASDKTLQKTLASARTEFSIIPLNQPSSNQNVSKKQIVDALLIMGAEKPINGILGIDGKNWGHSMNIQIDSKNKIYRLIDDNTGVIEYASPELFSEQISLYLTLLYSPIHTADLTVCVN